MRKVTSKKLVLSLITIVTMLISLFSMALPLCTLRYAEIDDNFTYYYHCSDNLLDMLIAKSSIIGIDRHYQWALGLMSASSWLQFFIAIAGVILSVISLLLFSEKAGKKLSLAFQIANLGIVGINALFGMTFAIIVADAFVYEDGKTFTMGWLSFLIISILFAAFIVFYVLNIKYTFVSGAETNNAEVVAAPHAVLVNEPLNTGDAKSKAKTDDEKIALMVKYKQLLDGGVISDEEFDKKKRELLGL